MPAGPLKSPGRLDVALALAGIAGGGTVAGYLAAGGDLSVTADLVAGAIWAASAALWRLFSGWAAISRGQSRPDRARGGAPFIPWIAAWPALLVATTSPLGRAQLLGARFGVAAYFLAWLLAGAAGLWLWLSAAPAGSVARSAPPAQTGPAPAATMSAWWLVAPLLAVAALIYWNSAVLDPLQARGFPDYVTQMKGARKLLAGLLPYDPTIRVWTDVNLPPITLLLLFAPFAAFPDLAGRLIYFALNHLAFFGGLAMLLLAARPPRRWVDPATWRAAVVAVALAYEPWHDSLRLGQQNGIVLFFLALTAAALLWRRDFLAGAGLVLALIGKPSSALLGLYFLFAARWRAIAGAFVVGLVALVATLPLTGLESWRFYLLDKAPQVLAGTPQQSNVALLALHARLFLPTSALSSFDAMPNVPVAQALTRVAQLLGLLALWRLVDTRRDRRDRTGILLEFSLALVLSLSLIGHAWQSYTTWLIVAFVPLLDPRVWAGIARRYRSILVVVAAACYVALGLNDVPLYKVVGNTTATGALFASLPNVALLVYAFVLALLLHHHDTAPGPSA